MICAADKLFTQLPFGPPIEKFITTHEIRDAIIEAVKSKAVTYRRDIFGIPILCYETEEIAFAATLVLQSMGEKVCLITTKPAEAKA